ncbi:MAG: TIGR03435 family protein [Bryobacteraceae bacterium]|jgi:uncharacterized protein (TIGR03435 family)
MRRLLPISLAAHAAFLCHAQDEPPRLQFDAAVIKLTVPPAPRVGCLGGPGTQDPTLLQCQNMSLRNLILWACAATINELSAPDWARTQVFDLTARVPPGTTVAQATEMLRNLLIDRFKLQTHREPRQTPGYELVVAKNGPKFHESVIDPNKQPPPTIPGEATKVDENGYPTIPQGRTGIMFRGIHGRMVLTGYTMERLAAQIATQLKMPVIDATGLTGKYDINLSWIQAGPDTDTDGPPMVQALQEQLGLGLKSKLDTINALVVDRLEKLPTEN